VVPNLLAPNRLASGLYVTATPIGNAADISLRALDVLSRCDAILAEDTRVSAKLLAIHGIRKPLVSYNDHNAPVVRPKVMERLQQGQALALISDAGTPLISDPGHKLVREARAAGIPVTPIPGASAALAALSAAGLPSDRFLFAGFLPAKSGERRAALDELASVPASLIFYESPQRLAASLADMAAALGPREAMVARELTKLFEEWHSGTLESLALDYANAPVPKGEIALVVAPPLTKASVGAGKLDRVLELALAHMGVKAAAQLAAEALEMPRREAYERALALQGKSDHGDR
jgi:16S rRNA (cytidine1402-2'-O)-methyltransferase